MMSKSQSIQNGTPQVQSVIIIAIALFAFSGLMVGFAVGAFTRPAKAPTTNNQNLTQLVPNHTTPTVAPTPTPTAAVFIHLGCPIFAANTTTNADGTIVYNASIQAKDKTGEVNGLCKVAQEKSIAANDIFCRIWLVPRDNDAQNDPGTHFINDAKDLLQHTDQLNQPFPKEVQNGLAFDPTTPNEVQPCPQGTAQWKFTIAPTVPKGAYNVVGLTDWQGKSYNWSWQLVTVGGGNQ